MKFYAEMARMNTGYSREMDKLKGETHKSFMEIDIANPLPSLQLISNPLLKYMSNEVADRFAPTVREVERLSDTRYTSTLYSLSAPNGQSYLNGKAEKSTKAWKDQKWDVPRL
jgi:hypothetical protein